MMTQEGGSHLQASEMGLRKSSLADTLASDSQLPDCKKIHFYCLSHPVHGICYDNPSNLHVLILLIFITVLNGRFYFPYVKKEEEENKKLSCDNLNNVPQRYPGLVHGPGDYHLMLQKGLCRYDQI